MAKVPPTLPNGLAQAEWRGEDSGLHFREVKLALLLPSEPFAGEFGEWERENGAFQILRIGALCADHSEQRGCHWGLDG